MVRKDTEDLCEVRINLARELCFGENIGKLRVAGNPVELMDTVLLTLKHRLMWQVLRVSLPFLTIWTVASLSIMRMAGIDGRR